MKVPLYLPPCDNCNRSAAVWIDAGSSNYEYQCECGEDRSGSFANDLTIGYQILWRSSHELMKTKDFDLSIVFAATAVECELTYFHHLWHEIDGLEKGYWHTKEELDQLLRKHHAVVTKIEKTASFVFPEGFKQFVISSPELSQTIQNVFPSLSLTNLTADIQEKLFWPRNEVLHSGKVKCTEQQATRAFNIALLSVKILHDLHEFVRVSS
jgi:hypothetical protein